MPKSSIACGGSRKRADKSQCSRGWKKPRDDFSRHPYITDEDYGWLVARGQRVQALILALPPVHLPMQRLSQLAFGYERENRWTGWTSRVPARVP